MKKKSEKTAAKPIAAFVLSLSAGILITASGIVLAIVSKLLSNRVGEIYITKTSFITLAGIFYPVLGLKLVMGVIIIFGATILFKSAPQRMTWGIVVLTLSIISLILSIIPPCPIGLIGSIMGIIGGALALGWK